jgi:hypothetical protein
VADPSETTQISRGPDDGTAGLDEAVRELSEELRDLQAELRTLRARPRGLPTRGGEPPGWETQAPTGDGLFWVRSLDSPRSRRPQVPRLLVEVLFLVVVAILLAVADAGAPVVVAVMAGAWVLVALAEWLAAREAELQRRAVYGAPSVYGLDDEAWFGPVELGEDGGARLPPPSTD